MAIERTQWRDRDLFVVSVLWDKRAIPIYWQCLEKQGTSNLAEQKGFLRLQLNGFATLNQYLPLFSTRAAGVPRQVEATLAAGGMRGWLRTYPNR